MIDARADYLRRLIAARAPELTDRDLGLLAAEPDLTPEIAAQVLVVVEALETRMDELAAAIEAEDDGDDDHDRRRA